MEETKPWYLSKTVWGAVVTMVIGVLALFGFGKLEGEQESITELLMQIVTVIAGIVALIGRITAKNKIT
jgi:hypothetical protein